jgi:pimeloyl-ACP methyl ester carboxylesterase
LNGQNAGFSAVYARAANVGQQLAHLLNQFGKIAPNRKIDIVAHSLGARVALQALSHLKRPNLGRMILMGAAEFRTAAKQAMIHSPKPGPEIYNFTSRENDLFDFLLEQMCSGQRHRDDCLGSGLPGADNTWIDIQIDHPRLPNLLKNRGIDLSPGRQALSHWGFYTRPGLFDLYSAILRDRPNWSIRALRSRMELPEQEPRWTNIRMPSLNAILPTRPAHLLGSKA